MFDFWKKKDDPRRISLAIPFYNRASLIMQVVTPVIRDPRLAEIVIQDDASDQAEYDRLLEQTKPFQDKIRVNRNPTNLGILGNKFQAVSACRTDWTIVFDSDNRFGTDYIDRLFCLREWAPGVIYCPGAANPHFSFRHLAGPLDYKRAKALIKDPGGIGRVLLNTGNYFVPVKEYCDFFARYQGDRVLAADSLFANYHWLKSGRRLQVVKGLEYEHMIHDDSYFKKTASESKRVIRELCDAWLNDREYRPEIAL